MPFFAIALVPKGNVLGTVYSIKASNLRPALAGYAQSLPEGIYLGFYEGRATRAEIASQCQALGASVFRHAPEKLVFSGITIKDRCTFIIPDDSLGKMRAECDEMAARLGISPSKATPFCPGMGFFMGKDVTLPAFEAFSFRHLDLVCMRMERGDDEWLSCSWTVIARSPRRIGLRMTHRTLEE